MQNSTKLAAGVVVVCLLVVGAIWLNKPASAPLVQAPIGAQPGTDNTGPCQSLNGRLICVSAMAMNNASGTPCTIKNPIAATSTMSRFVASITATTNGNIMDFDLSTSTVSSGTSTISLLKNVVVQANSKKTFIWEPMGVPTTAGVLVGTNIVTGENNIVIGPNDFVNLKMGTSTDPSATIVGPIGTCKATFESVI